MLLDIALWGRPMACGGLSAGLSARPFPKQSQQPDPSPHQHKGSRLRNAACGVGQRHDLNLQIRVDRSSQYAHPYAAPNASVWLPPVVMVSDVIEKLDAEAIDVGKASIWFNVVTAPSRTANVNDPLLVSVDKY